MIIITIHRGLGVVLQDNPDVQLLRFGEAVIDLKLEDILTGFFISNIQLYSEVSGYVHLCPFTTGGLVICYPIQ